MVDTIGRHRAPGGYSAINELTLVFGGITAPVAKTSAVLAASGGLVAAVALPASAAPTSPAAPAAPVSASAASATPATRAAQAVTAPIPAAPSVQATTADFGSVSVKAVAKPRPRPQPEPEQQPEAAPTTPERTQSAPSRNQQRSAAPASTPDPAADPGDNLPAASGVVAIARQYIGVPYVYGGSSPSGFDCSGFTSYVFAKVGKSLPRTAAAQQAAARRVSNPQPGDLVFFGSPAYHVGIYVGNGRMIDSPRTGMSVTVRPIFGGVSGYGRF